MTVPLRYVLREIDDRRGTVDLPLLAVSIHRGVVPRDALTDRESRADDLSNYKVCWAGDIVLNRMRAFQGAIGISPSRGLVSPDYMVLRSKGADARYLSHLFRSGRFIAEMTARIRGIGSVDLGSARTPRINASDLLGIEIRLPGLDEQRRIADFLDDQVARIDAVVGARRAQAEAAERMFARAVVDSVSGGGEPGPRKPSGLPWLGEIPEAWPVLAVSSQFETVLGKMLDAAVQDGANPLAYLRNTNVQWDRIDTSDVKVMDIHPTEYARCTVRRGDLLICEGGQPGRAAIWDGSIEPMGFQKALHRARSLGRSHAAWLLNCLRAATIMDAFAGENGVTTIGHLTGEQLREQKFPFPDPATQMRLFGQIDEARRERDRALETFGSSVRLLTEYKQALISAAVSGEFDVTTAPGRALPTV